MNYKQHVICSLGFCSLVILIIERFSLIPLDLGDYIKYFLVSVVASFLPDFDHPDAHFTKNIPLILISAAVPVLFLQYFFSDIALRGVNLSQLDIVIYLAGFLGLFIYIFSRVIHKISGHRGITHAPFVYLLFALVSLIFWFISNLVKKGQFDFLIILFSLGSVIFGHIIPDGFSGSGVPLLIPLTKKKFHTIPFSFRPIAGPVSLFSSLVLFIYCMVTVVF